MYGIFTCIWWIFMVDVGKLPYMDAMGYSKISPQIQLSRGNSLGLSFVWGDHFLEMPSFWGGGLGFSVTKTVKLLNLCFEKNLHFGSFENPSELTNDIGKSACLLGNTSTHSWWILLNNQGPFFSLPKKTQSSFQTCVEFVFHWSEYIESLENASKMTGILKINLWL